MDAPAPDLVITDDMVKEDEEYLDGKGADVPETASDADAGASAAERPQGDTALQKLLSVAETVSNFYSAQGGGGSSLPKGFKGELYEYQKKVGVGVRGSQWRLLC